MGDTTPIPAPSRELSGSAYLTVLVAFVPDRPLLLWYDGSANLETVRRESLPKIAKIPLPCA